MDSLTGALVAAAAAWASVLAAVFLPVPDLVFQRLRWVGAATIVVVGFALLGVPVPDVVPAVVFVGGAVAAFAWPRDRRAEAPVQDAPAQRDDASL